MNHGIILGGMLEREDTSETRNYLTSQDEKDKPDYWPGIKRSAGGHRIATFLRENNWDIEVLDFWPTWTRDELTDFFDSRVTKDTKFVGISAMFPAAGSSIKNQKHFQEMQNNVHYLRDRYPQLTWVAGAQNLSAVLGYPVDYYFSSFAEYGLLEFLNWLTGVPGADPKIKTRNYWGADRQVVECRTDFPAWPMPNANVSYEDRDFLRPDEVLTVELGRGCKFQCKFCSFTVLGVKGDMSRCEDNLYQELRENYVKWGIQHYTVGDETINDSKSKLAKCARAVKRIKEEFPEYEIQLSGYARADLMVNWEDTWQDLWDMGLWSMFYGIESFNHEAAKFVGKGMDPQKMKDGLLKAQDFFKSKGKFRATLSMIIGLPHETRETFLEGRDWIFENFPGHAYGFIPLMIADGEMFRLATNPSIFDKTVWDEGSPFTRVTEQDMNVNYDEIRPELRDIVKFYINSPGVANWQHSTMNVWEAWKVFDEVAGDPQLPSKLAPGVFFYHRYLTGGRYTIDDMTKTFAEIEPLGKKQIDMHLDIIQEYKYKKINWERK